MQKLISNDYIIFINNNSVQMAHRDTQTPHNLNSLTITHHDIDFYLTTQDMGYDDIEKAFKQVIIDAAAANDASRLNTITSRNFVFA